MCSTHPVPSKPKTSPLAAETTSTSARSPTVSGFGVHNPVAESNTSESPSAGVSVSSTSEMDDIGMGDASHRLVDSFQRSASASSGLDTSTSGRSTSLALVIAASMAAISAAHVMFLAAQASSESARTNSSSPTGIDFGPAAWMSPARDDLATEPILTHCVPFHDHMALSASLRWASRGSGSWNVQPDGVSDATALA